MRCTDPQFTYLVEKFDGRNARRELSFALSGDHIYKQNKSVSDRDQMITALPDVRTMPLETSDQFMVLACDGIWQVMLSVFYFVLLCRRP